MSEYANIEAMRGALETIGGDVFTYGGDSARTPEEQIAFLKDLLRRNRSLARQALGLDA